VEVPLSCLEMSSPKQAEQWLTRRLTYSKVQAPNRSREPYEMQVGREAPSTWAGRSVVKFLNDTDLLGQEDIPTERDKRSRTPPELAIGGADQAPTPTLRHPRRGPIDQSCSGVNPSLLETPFGNDSLNGSPEQDVTDEIAHDVAQHEHTMSDADLDGCLHAGALSSRACCQGLDRACCRSWSGAGEDHGVG
jgi:hypothetical protein